mmetsp:Transcript_40918/g.49654  ORF Transcript_40918/g.49654 Transcript_40918/m.49654 type:complete len:202 (-) Transcript_40918:301-906(-)|eukprot:CAMPEP_0197846668 /NCGR_PEP_ID=MMETSP1438-20131217/3997_1 /TAXON_ID=1461541 /ORGANISM="Pterosperma sp., Strain CCMP1384" /LENGTH=201 /DNA_ID=CAMNT_0043458391 /DNA_START=58 /DNA_END=663 /DNA_ORIENTATION=-
MSIATTSSIFRVLPAQRRTSRSRNASSTVSVLRTRSNPAKSLPSASSPHAQPALRRTTPVNAKSQPATAITDKVTIVKSVVPDAAPEKRSQASYAGLALVAGAALLCFAPEAALAADPSGVDRWLLSFLGIAGRFGCIGAALITFGPNFMMTSSGKGGAVLLALLADVVWVLGGVLPGSVTQTLVIFVIGALLQSSALSSL